MLGRDWVFLTCFLYFIEKNLSSVDIQFFICYQIAECFHVGFCILVKYVITVHELNPRLVLELVVETCNKVNPHLVLEIVVETLHPWLIQHQQCFDSPSSLLLFPTNWGGALVSSEGQSHGPSVFEMLCLKHLPTVFKTSKWNLLYMIPMTCRCAWHCVRPKG